MALILSCSTSTESVNGIVLSSNSEELIIKNLAASKIYFFAVESNFAEHINWAALKTGPFLEIGGSVKIGIIEIPNGSSQPVKMGDRVIVYWWTDDYKDHSDIKGEAIVI